MKIALIVLAFAVIAALGTYAGMLLFKLRQQTEKQNAVRQERVDNISESIEVIAKAMTQQQCEVSEGAIRICNLLAALPIKDKPDYTQQFPFIHTLFVEVSGFAILEDRKKLSKTERRKQDKAREEIEAKHESKVLGELDAISQYAVQLRG